MINNNLILKMTILNDKAQYFFPKALFRFVKNSGVDRKEEDIRLKIILVSKVL